MAELERVMDGWRIMAVGVGAVCGGRDFGGGFVRSLRLRIDNLPAMSSKAKPKSRKQTQKKSTASSSASVSSASSNALSSGYLLTCDPPAKQFILHLNDTKIADKKFIIEDLDATHLLIKGEVRDEITRKVEEWMDEVSRVATCLKHKK